jgi:hypothetical protein
MTYLLISVRFRLPLKSGIVTIVTKWIQEVIRMANAYERLMVASPAYLDVDWLPPEDVSDLLRDLRSEHVRLVGAMRQALVALGEAQQRVAAAEEGQMDAKRNAFLNGTTATKMPEIPRAELRDAQQTYQAATEALEEFVHGALREIQERAPRIRVSLRVLSLQAEAKRAEARRLLEEAEMLAARPKRLDNWLARYDGRSVLGPMQWTVLGDVTPEPRPQLVDDLARLSPGVVLDANYPTTDEEMEALSNA